MSKGSNLIQLNLHAAGKQARLRGALHDLAHVAVRLALDGHDGDLVGRVERRELDLQVHKHVGMTPNIHQQTATPCRCLMVTATP